MSDNFEELDAATLNKVFVTLQSIFIEIMKEKGGNKHKIPHLNKDRLMRLGILPESLEVERELVLECMEFLNLPENDCGSSYDLQPLKTVLGI